MSHVAFVLNNKVNLLIKVRGKFSESRALLKWRSAFRVLPAHIRVHHGTQYRLPLGQRKSSFFCGCYCCVTVAQTWSSIDGAFSDCLMITVLRLCDISPGSCIVFSSYKCSVLVNEPTGTPDLTYLPTTLLMEDQDGRFTLHVAHQLFRN